MSTPLPYFKALAQTSCVLQGTKIQQAYMDIYKLARPIFSGIGADVLACEARIDSKVPLVLMSNLQYMLNVASDRLLHYGN